MGRFRKVSSMGAELVFITGAEDGIRCPKCNRIYRIPAESEVKDCLLCGSAVREPRTVRIMMPKEEIPTGPKGGGKRLSLEEISNTISSMGGTFVGTIDGEPYHNNKTHLAVRCSKGTVRITTWMKLSKDCWCNCGCKLKKAFREVRLFEQLIEKYGYIKAQAIMRIHRQTRLNIEDIIDEYMY